MNRGHDFQVIYILRPPTELLESNDFTSVYLFGEGGGLGTSNPRSGGKGVSLVPGLLWRVRYLWFQVPSGGGGDRYTQKRGVGIPRG